MEKTCRATKIYATSDSSLVGNKLSDDFIAKDDRITTYLKTLEEVVDDLKKF